jgi:predicted dehydrogenase
VVGAGRRGEGFAEYALEHPERMRVAAVAEPNAERRRHFAARHGLAADAQFADHAELLRARPPVRAVINTTRDKEHYRTALPLLEAGYDMLLEKPIATTEPEVRALIGAARKLGRTVMICHVLRYAPFYATIKRLVNEGRIGRIVSMNTLEAVSYHHMSTGYVRGRWHRTDASGPMLLNKCCHDLDLVAWLLSGVRAARVASFGSLRQFRRENAPPGSAERCLDGCGIERECPYSCRRIFVEKLRWGGYAFQELSEGGRRPSDAEKLEHLRTASPYGRCVWRCDNDVVDHQSVLVEFADGTTATHDMFCATARPERRIHIVGTAGEIEGEMEAGWIKLRRPDLRPVPDSNTEELVRIDEDLGTDGGGHGGGDERLIADFVAVLRGEPGSRGTTRIEDSLTGHLICFAADTAMRERRVVEIAPD